LASHLTRERRTDRREILNTTLCVLSKGCQWPSLIPPPAVRRLGPPHSDASDESMSKHWEDVTSVLKDKTRWKLGRRLRNELG
jgi:hypothetical protein